MKIPAGLKPWLVVLALFVLPYFLLLSYFSYFGKDVTYLRGGGPPWILNPEDRPVVNGFPTDFPATYVKMFSVESPPVRGRISVNAVGGYVLRVNDALLSNEEETTAKNWKSAQEYDITPYLRRGANYINIYVHSPYSVTAIKVAGEAEDANGVKYSLDSGDSWMVASAKSFPPMNITANVLNPVYIPRQETFSEKLNSGEYWTGSLYLFGASGILIAAIFLFPGIFKGLDALFFMKPAPKTPAAGRAGKYFQAVAIVAVFAVLGITLYNNFLKYPAERTGDFEFHLEYLNHFLGSWRVPLASEGFQMYNPPLYYLTSAVLYKTFGAGPVMADVVRYAQLLNTVSTFATICLVFLIIKRVIGDTAPALLAFAVAAFLPMCLYKAPSVSGESFFTFLSTLIFYVWLRYLDGPRTILALITGFFVGLAFMTRYTALFPTIGVLAGFLYLVVRDTGNRKKRLFDMTVFLAVMLAVSGWYYARNLIHFHHLFPIASTPELFFYRQVPGYRDWDFYTNVSSLLINNPLGKDNVTESLFAGCYSTFWNDGQRLFVVTRDYVLVFIALALALLPSALMISGAAKAAEKATSGGLDSRTLFLGSCLITAALGICAFVLGSHRFPTYAWQKSFYFMFCLVPFVCFLGLGLKGLVARSGWVFIALWTAALCLVNLRIFYL